MTSEFSSINYSTKNLEYITRTFKYYELRIFNISYEIDFNQGPFFLKNIIYNIYREFLLIEDNIQLLKDLFLTDSQQRDVALFVSTQTDNFKVKLQLFEKVFRSFLR